MTPDTRSSAPFELRRFTAAAVSADLAVVELEGRFSGARGRFGRRPVLVVEEPGAPRTELPPVRARLDGERWRSSFAVPLGALQGGCFALGVGGVLFDLPAPDSVADGDRLAAVAREANALRRRVEALEAERDAAVADAAQARGELEGAVAAAREAVAAASAERISDLETEVVAAHRTAEGDAESARTMAEDAQRAAVAAVEGRLAAERERAEVAEARAAAAEERERHEAAGADVLRAELAEERERAQAAIGDLQASLDEAVAAAAEAEGRATPEERPPGAREDRAEPDPTQAMDVEPETTVARRPGRGPSEDDLDDDDSRPIPLRQAPPLRPPLRPPRPDAPPEPVHHHGPALSPWVAVVALGVFAFLVVALVLGVLS